MDSIMDAVKEWHEYAERDLSSAKYLLNMRPVPLEIIAYLCQQCAEKYLKSYLVYNDQDVIKTHDLVELIKLCAEFEKEFLSLEKQCTILFKYVTDTRYPRQKLELNDYDIKKALEYAEVVKNFVLNKIQEVDTSNIKTDEQK